MSVPEGRIPPLKRGAAALAKILPASWRFPVCGLSASTCGLEATQPLRLAADVSPDPALLEVMAKFLGPDARSASEIVRAHVVMVPRGIAWSRGAHLTADGRVIDPLSVGMTFPMSHWLLKRQRFFPKMHRVSGTVISLATDGHNNFYHWMLDLLPKLFLVLALGLKEEPIYIGASHRFQVECLRLLGIPAERILDGNATPFVQADTLIVPFLGERHPPNVFSAAKCRVLVEVFSSRIQTENSQARLPLRFVVSRSRTRSRRVVNEVELMARLAPLGFEMIFLEDFSFVEQMVLFARAEAIVASTGAGLIHLIHARPGTPVAILMPDECPDLVCRDMAEFARLRCEIFYAERHPKGTLDKIGCDMILDETILARVVGFFAP
jgi:hypothetical protein